MFIPLLLGQKIPLDIDTEISSSSQLLYIVIVLLVFLLARRCNGLLLDLGASGSFANDGGW